MKAERVQAPLRAVAGGGTVAIVERKHRFASPHQALNYVNALYEAAMELNRFPFVELYLGEVTVRLGTSRKADINELEAKAAAMLEGLI